MFSFGGLGTETYVSFYYYAIACTGTHTTLMHIKSIRTGFNECENDQFAMKSITTTYSHVSNYISIVEGLIKNEMELREMSKVNNE